MLARIFKPAPSATQSGRAKSRDWVLEFERSQAPLNEPLMGWTSSGDTSTQIRLTFDTREDAVAWAEANNIAFRVIEPPERRLIIKAYADNFAYNRKQPWTH